MTATGSLGRSDQGDLLRSSPVGLYYTRIFDGQKSRVAIEKPSAEKRSESEVIGYCSSKGRVDREMIV